MIINESIIIPSMIMIVFLMNEGDETETSPVDGPVDQRGGDAQDEQQSRRFQAHQRRKTGHQEAAG